jgi:hypothetical protein
MVCFQRMRRNHKIWTMLTEFEQKHEEEWHEISHEILRQMYPGRGATDEDLLALLESMTDQELDMFVNAARKRFEKETEKYEDEHMREKFKKLPPKKKSKKQLQQEEQEDQEEAERQAGLARLNDATEQQEEAEQEILVEK